jgi:pyruvate carboxylase
VNIVQSQLRIAAGASLEDLGLASQEDVRCIGHAMQCRVTTEDASRGFVPDTGTIEVFRAPTGMGIRLDDGPGFVGAKITPFYDSLLVKLTGSGQSREAVAKTLLRALAEFRIRGVTTNIPYVNQISPCVLLLYRAATHGSSSRGCTELTEMNSPFRIFQHSFF